EVPGAAPARGAPLGDARGRDGLRPGGRRFHDSDRLVGAPVADIAAFAGNELGHILVRSAAERAAQSSEPHRAPPYNVLLTLAVAATFSGSGVKSSPGLMKRSFSKRYCLS